MFLSLHDDTKPIYNDGSSVVSVRCENDRPILDNFPVTGGEMIPLHELNVIHSDNRPSNSPLFSELLWEHRDLATYCSSIRRQIGTSLVQKVNST